MKYPKHILVMKNKTIDLGENLTLTEDLDVTWKELSFRLPYIVKGALDTTDFKRYDRVQLYAQFFASAAARAGANINNMTKIFDGFANSITLSEGKTSGAPQDFTCRGTGALLYERTPVMPFFSGSVAGLIDIARTQGLNPAVIPDIITEGVSDRLLIKVQTEKQFGKVLDTIRQKYALHVYQLGSGAIRVQSPFFLSQKTVTEALVYDLTSNCFNVDHGDVATQIDCVVVYGNNCVGVAFDPIGFQLRQGIAPEDVQASITPGKNELSVERLFRRDLNGAEECQEVARNRLVELARNYQISLEVEPVFGREVGEPFIVKNSRKILPTQVWIEKKRVTVLSKEDIKTTVTGYSNSISTFPDDLLLSSTGILDTDILEVTEKVEKSFKLHA